MTTLPGTDNLPIGSGPARDVRKETIMLETLSRHWWAVALRGVAAILFGVLALVWPGITVFALVIVFGAYALDIVAAFQLRKEMRREWLLALSGALSVLFGVLLVVWPAAGVLTLIVPIGIAAIAFGITLLMLGLRLRRERRHDPAAAGRHHRPATA
jgi:uncharacterized membrane protein HdeD (DUF308 family)